MQPLLPGEKRQKEEWENVYVYGMTFNLLLIIAIATLKPDTRYCEEPPNTITQICTLCITAFL